LWSEKSKKTKDKPRSTGVLYVAYKTLLRGHSVDKSNHRSHVSDYAMINLTNGDTYNNKTHLYNSFIGTAYTIKRIKFLLSGKTVDFGEKRSYFSPLLDNGGGEKANTMIWKPAHQKLWKSRHMYKGKGSVYIASLNMFRLGVDGCYVKKSNNNVELLSMMLSKYVRALRDKFFDKDKVEIMRQRLRDDIEKEVQRRNIVVPHDAVGDDVEENDDNENQESDMARLAAFREQSEIDIYVDRLQAIEETMKRPSDLPEGAEHNLMALIEYLAQRSSTEEVHGDSFIYMSLMASPQLQWFIREIGLSKNGLSKNESVTARCVQYLAVYYIGQTRVPSRPLRFDCESEDLCGSEDRILHLLHKSQRRACTRMRLDHE
jgi:hypothetical protein